MTKRVFSAFLCIFLCAMLCVPVGAAPQDAAVNDHLILHYDFEGATAEEALRDKAFGGTQDERLYLTNTSSSANTVIANGVARINNDAGSYIRRRLHGTAEDAGQSAGPCRDLVSLASAAGYTLSVKANVITPQYSESTQFSDVADIGRLIRIYTVTPAENSTKLDLYARFTDDAYGETEHQFKIGQVTAGEMFVLTASVAYASDTIDATFYLSADGGATYATAETTFPGVSDYLAGAGLEESGKAWGGIGLGIPTPNTHRENVATVEYDDLRLYSKPLDEADAKGIHAAAPTPETPALRAMQTSAVNAQAGTYAIRLISTVDSCEAYCKIGYLLSYSTDGGASYGEPAEISGRIVYSSLLENTDLGMKTVTAEDLGGTYIFACGVRKIPTSVTNFKVTMFTVGLEDGTTTTYDTYCITFSEGVFVSTERVGST